MQPLSIVLCSILVRLSSLQPLGEAKSSHHLAVCVCAAVTHSPQETFHTLSSSLLPGVNQPEREEGGRECGKGEAKNRGEEAKNGGERGVVQAGGFGQKLLWNDRNLKGFQKKSLSRSQTDGGKRGQARQTHAKG